MGYFAVTEHWNHKEWDWNLTPNSAASECRLSAKNKLRDSPSWKDFFLDFGIGILELELGLELELEFDTQFNIGK